MSLLVQSRLSSRLPWLAKAVTSTSSSSCALPSRITPAGISRSSILSSHLQPACASARRLFSSSPYLPFPSTSTSSDTVHTFSSSPHDLSITVFRTSSSPARTTFEIHSPTNSIPHPTSFSARWLRDSDPSPTSISPSSTQKVHASTSIDPSVTLCSSRPNPIELVQDVEKGASLRIWWKGTGLVEGRGPKKGTTEDWCSTFPLSFLAKHVNSSSPEHNIQLPCPQPWNRSSLLASTLLPFSTSASSSAPSSIQPPSSSLGPLSVPYSLFLHDDHTNHQALTHLQTHGLVILKGVPTSPTSDEACKLRDVARRIGEIRHTFYGEVWDVKSLGELGKNVAYTNVELGFHMDLLYFVNPPRFQLLHSLISLPPSLGGSSLFTDALHSLSLLSPDQFRLLASTPIPYIYDNDGHHLERSHPVIDIPEGKEMTLANVRSVNWAPMFQGVLPLETFGGGEEGERVLEAMRAFEQGISSEEAKLEVTLEQGDCAIFDNRRVLHARSAFNDPTTSSSIDSPLSPSPSAAADSEGDASKKGVSRWLKGCYVDGDAAWDRWRVLEARRRRGEL